MAQPQFNMHQSQSSITGLFNLDSGMDIQIFKTVFQLLDKGYSKVELHGSWDSWAGFVQLKLQEGLWRCQISLSKDNYSYLFKVDNEWALQTLQPSCLDERGVVSNLLRMNSTPVFLKMFKQKQTVFQKSKKLRRQTIQNDQVLYRKEKVRDEVKVSIKVRGKKLQNLIREEEDFRQRQTTRDSPSDLLLKKIITNQGQNSIIRAFSLAYGESPQNQQPFLLAYSGFKVKIWEAGVQKLVSFFALVEGHSSQKCALLTQARIFDIFCKQPSCISDPRASLIDSFQILQKELQEVEGGCSCIAVLLVDETLFIANVGACRAVLGSYPGKVKPLTLDHVPSNPRERIRVELEGGQFCYNRLHLENQVINQMVRLYPGSALTRSLGDASLKKEAKGLSALVDVFEHSLDQSDQFLILGTKELFHRLTNQDARDMAARQLSLSAKLGLKLCCQNAAASAIETARRRGAGLNCGCMVLALQNGRSGTVGKVVSFTG